MNSLPKFDPENFNELGYRSIIRRLGFSIIDAEGPVAFDYLATRIARAHGFRRTGGRIRQQVESALGRQRQKSRGPDGEKIYWPMGKEPQKVTAFRGLVGAGGARSWAEVPYPGKLGLARAVQAAGPYEDTAAAMAGIIGLGRLRRKTREELEDLLRKVTVLQESEAGGDE